MVYYRLMISVKKLAEQAGVSIRTLHYYDQIGLLKPGVRKPNGYRYYDETDVFSLQQILLFRESGFSLEEIKTILGNPDYNTFEAMIHQRVILQKTKERLNAIIGTLDKTMKSKRTETSMKITDYYKGFSDEPIERYRIDVRRRWGRKVPNAGEQEIRNQDKERFITIQAEGGEIFRAIYSNMSEGYRSDFIQNEVERWRQWLENFHHYTDDEVLWLGRAYSRNPEFIMFFKQYDESLPFFLTKAIEHNVTHRKQKNRRKKRI